MRMPKTPERWPCENGPQFTAPRPWATTADPIRPPTSACEDEEGIPRYQVKRFQTTAPVSPAPMTGTMISGDTSTILATVSATAAPSRKGPTRFASEAMMTAGTGLAARVATSVAMALAASWKPVVSAKARATRMAATRTRSKAHSGSETIHEPLSPSLPGLSSPSCGQEARMEPIHPDGHRGRTRGRNRIPSPCLRVWTSGPREPGPRRPDPVRRDPAAGMGGGRSSRAGGRTRQFHRRALDPWFQGRSAQLPCRPESILS